MNFLPTSSAPMILLRLGIVLLATLGGPAIADDTARNKALESIYTYSGVQAHLSWVHKTVVDESLIAWQGCNNALHRAQMESMLKDNLSIEQLRQNFLNELDQRINESLLVPIVSWTQSDAGKKIYQAELESLDFDETTFKSLLESYKQSKTHGDARNALLRNILADTGAVYFLSALNTEVSALVSIASVCSNSEDDLVAAQKQIDEDRASEALYRSFMRQELLIPSAVVYRNISDAELDALSEFAKSDAGDAYYTALIKGTRSLLESQVVRLRETLETMPPSAD